MVAYLIHPNTSLSTHSIHSNLPQPPFLHPLSSHPPFLRLSHQLTVQQHLICRVVQSLHTNHMQMSIIEVSICRHPHMDTSLILICIWLVCRLCTTLHTKCCGAVCRPTIPIIPLNKSSLITPTLLLKRNRHLRSKQDPIQPVIFMQIIDTPGYLVQLVPIAMISS